MNKRGLWLFLIYMTPVLLWGALAGGGVLYLPGTQPGDLAEEFQSPSLCRYCHGDFDYAKEPYFQWFGGMMSQAARNPVFRAAATIAEQDAAGVGTQFCWRCHGPSAWLGGRTDPVDGSNLTQQDLEGVSCDVCHRMVDPLSEEGRSLVQHDVPYYGNSMFVISPDFAKRGPRSDAVANHEWQYSEYHKSGNFCGTCHDISNPLRAQNPLTQKPYRYGPSTRTFSEWELSQYARMGEQGNCQSCHMPRGVGRSASMEFAPIRPDLAIHSQTGANYWALEILPLFWDYDPIQLDALWAGRQRSIELIRRSAKLSLVSTPEQTPGNLTVRVTNLTGHKFPTGNLIRRAWLNVQFMDASGQVITESGGYNWNTGQLTHDNQAKVYEFLRATEDGAPTLHHVLSKSIVKDNRIPPRGFRNTAFARRMMAPVGATYADKQYWDDTTYHLPAGTTHVRVTLYYQVMTKEYVEMLRDHNHTNDWGQRVYNAWLATGKAAPIPVTTLVWPKNYRSPSAPGNLQAQGISFSRVRLTWTASGDDDAVVYYEIWRKKQEENHFQFIGTTARAETEYVDVALQPGQTYSYYVKAVDTGAYRSVRSNLASGTTHDE